MMLRAIKIISRGVFPLIIFFSISGQSQQLEGNWWYFGFYAGLHFTNGYPEADTNSQLQTSSGAATYSDSNGNLIFYTDGNTVLNRNHSIVPNGTNLVDNNQSRTLITNIPNKKDRFLCFVTTNENNNSGSLIKFEFDRTLNNGLGNVVPGSKDTVIQNISWGIACVDHQNNLDKWITVHSDTGDFYYSFLIDSMGVSTTPVTTQIGHSIGSTASSPVRHIKNAPNSDYFVSVYAAPENLWELFEYNRQTGQIIGRVLINYGAKEFFTAAFSSNSEYLYTGQVDSLHQLNVMSLDSASIINSKITVFGNATTPSIYFPFYDMQLAIDGKIYFINAFSTITRILGVINCPNLEAPSCNYVDTVVDLKGRPPVSHLPTLNQTLFVNANILQAQSQSGDICDGDTAQLIAYGAGADRFIWTMEDGSPANTLSDDTLANPKAWPDSTTTYRVIGMSSSCSSADGDDTAFVTVRVGNGPEEPLFPDSVSRCVNDTFTAQLPAQTPFWWSTGADTHVVQLTQSDTYRYVYADSLGCASDTFSFALQFFDSAVVELDADSQLCELEEGQANVISQTAVNWTTTAEILESDLFYIRYRAQNPFWLRAAPQDSNACAVSDSVFVTVIPTPDAGTDFDTVLCLPDSFPFIPNAPQLSPLRFVRESTGDTLRAADWPKMLFAEGVLTERFIAFNPQNCSDTIHVNAELLLPQTEPEGNFEILRDCEKAVLRIFPQTGVAWYLNGNEMPLEDIRVSDGDSFLIAEYDESRRCLRTTKLVIGEGSAALGVELPNVFTPNGDGVNDIFEPLGPVNHVCGTLQVYNRWGNLVHETLEGAGISWNGRNFSGEPVPEGTYFYVFTSGDEVVKGSVQVLR